MINEVDSDQPGNDTSEFVELFDGGAGHTPLNGLVLVLFNGAADTSYAAFDLDGFTTNAQGYFTLGNSGVAGVDLVLGNGTLQNGPDAVAIYRASASDFPNGTPVTTTNLQDSLVYDTGQPDDAGLLVLLNPGQIQVNENGTGDSATVSMQRCPDGSGDFRNTSSYALHAPTAAGPNSCPAPSPSPSPSPSASPSPTPSPSATPSPSPSPDLSPLPSPSPSASPSPLPTPTSAIVISEFRTRGPNGANDEFVELYNNSNVPIDVSGWKIRGSNNAASVTTRVTINNGTTIPARGHFLTTNGSANGYSGSVAGDQTYTGGITNDGGVAVTLPDDSVVDQVGLSAGSAFKEGTNVAPLLSDANQSYERKPGGPAGSSQDTGDNFNDFQLITSDPQNLNSPPTPGVSPSPSPISSPSPSPSPSASPSPSPPQIPFDRVVISQVYGGGGNAGAPFANDFIEIFNAGNTPVNLSGWSVQYAGATAANWSMTSLSPVLLLPGQYYLIQEASGGAVGVGLPTADATGTATMAAAAGKVALVHGTTALSGSGCPFGPNVVDFIGYGSSADCFEGAGRAPTPGNTTAAIRTSSGCTDTNNNSTNFASGTPSPRNTMSAPNLCPGTSTLREVATAQSISWPRRMAWLLFRTLISA